MKRVVFSNLLLVYGNSSGMLQKDSGNLQIESIIGTSDFLQANTLLPGKRIAQFVWKDRRIVVTSCKSIQPKFLGLEMNLRRLNIKVLLCAVSWEIMIKYYITHEGIYEKIISSSILNSISH